MVWVAGVVLPSVVVKQILWMKKELEGEVEPQCVVVESG